MWVDDRPFLGRGDEQRRFEAILSEFGGGRAGVLQRRAVPPLEWSRIVLIEGTGGIGKSMLARRFRSQTVHELGADRVAWVDWEEHRRDDARLAAHESVEFEVVLDHLRDAVSRALRSDRFREYDSMCSARRSVIEHVNSEMAAAEDRSEAFLRPAAQLGARALSELLRHNVGGNLGVEGEALVQEALRSGADGLVDFVPKVERWLGARLDHEQLEIFRDPQAALASAFASDLRTLTVKTPLAIFLDTYEIVDAVDRSLRVLQSEAGMRILWVLAGRRPLSESRRLTGAVERGYRAEVPDGRLEVFRLGEFTLDDIRTFLALRAPERPASDEDVAAIHAATLGVPLAIELASEIWRSGAPRLTITDAADGGRRRDRNWIVRQMAERFLVHATERERIGRDYGEDLWRLKLLALCDREDAALLGALWDLDVEAVSRALAALERRYEFVIPDEMRLHDSVRDAVRAYLLRDLQRAQPRVMEANARAIALLEQRLAMRERSAATIEDRVADERWVADRLSVVVHRMWLDATDGWGALLTASAMALPYAPAITRALLAATEVFAPTWTAREREVHTELRQSLSSLTPRRGVGALTEALRRAGCEALPDSYPNSIRQEYRAIVLWMHGEQAIAEDRLASVLAEFLDAADCVPEAATALRELLARSLTEFSHSQLWRGGRRYASPSERGLRAAQAAVALDPSNGAAWHVLAVALQELGRMEAAVEAASKRLDLEESAVTLVTLGHGYRALRRYEDAIRVYSRAAEIGGVTVRTSAQVGIAETHLDRGDAAEAVALLEQIVARDEGERPLTALGNAFLAIGEPAKALDAYERAYARNPDDPISVANLGEALLHSGDLDRARTCTEQAVALRHVPSARDHVVLGVIAAVRGETAEADALFAKALTCSEQGSLAASFRRYYIAVALLWQGRTEASLAELREAMQFASPGERLELIHHPPLEVLAASASVPPPGLDDFAALKAAGG
jgi:tetratricopeptide (TPR) repeat protein